MFVELRDVCKSYRLGDGTPVRAANHVNLSLGAGGSLALVGPSGSGKSTLLQLIGGLDRADSGSITVAGVQLSGASRSELADYRRRIGFIFQRFHLISALNALDNVCIALNGSVRRREAVARASEMLERVGLGGRVASFPAQLSGGQQQRVAVARALVVRPVLLLADEPTGNLDSVSAASVMELITELREQDGYPLIMATHDAGISQAFQRRVRIVDGVATEDDHSG